MEGGRRGFQLLRSSEVAAAEKFRLEFFEEGRRILALPEVASMKAELAAKMDAIQHKSKKYELVRPLINYESQATFVRKYAGSMHFIDTSLYTAEKINALMQILGKRPDTVVQRLQALAGMEKQGPEINKIKDISCE
jgi:hypothetical protein